MINWIQDFYVEGSKGIYKSSGRAFHKSFRAFITKFAKLIDDVESNESVAEYIKKNPKWESFKKTKLRPLIKQEEKQLAGGSCRQFNEEEKVESEEDGNKEDGHGDDDNADSGTKEDEDEVVKIPLNEMPESTTEPVDLEDNIQGDFVSNNYWAKSVGSIKELEDDYD